MESHHHRVKGRNLLPNESSKGSFFFFFHFTLFCFPFSFSYSIAFLFSDPFSFSFLSPYPFFITHTHAYYHPQCVQDGILAATDAQHASRRTSTTSKTRLQTTPSTATTAGAPGAARTAIPGTTTTTRSTAVPTQTYSPSFRSTADELQTHGSRKQWTQTRTTARGCTTTTHATTAAQSGS